MDEKAKTNESSSCTNAQPACMLILEDLLIRLDGEAKKREEMNTKLDSRLDDIEKEIASVKKVMSVITWIFKIVPTVIAIFTVIGKYIPLKDIWDVIPKGRGGRK